MCGVCFAAPSWIWGTLIMSVLRWAKKKCKGGWIRRALCKLAKWIVWILALIAAVILVIIWIILCPLCMTLCLIVCFIACVLNKIFGRPAPSSCFDCWGVCRGTKSPADVTGGGGGTSGITVTPPSSGSTGVSGSGPLSGATKRAWLGTGLATEAPRARACGCEEGAVLLLLSTCAYVGYLFFARANVSALRLPDLAWGVGVMFFGALTGKIVGLLRAHLVLRGQ